MRPKILFLMAQYPDVDHLVPLADLLAEQGRYEVTILSYQNRVDFERDPRILYLKKRHGIVVKPIERYYPVSSRLPWKLYEWRTYWGKKCKDTRPYFLFGRNLKSFFMPRFHVFRISRLLIDRILAFWLGRKSWGVSVLRQERPSVVVIDHAFVTYWIESFIDAVRRAGIPTVALPHSSFMFTHTHVLENEKGVPLQKTNEDEFPWDCVIVESGMRVTLLEELGISEQRMFPLGCLRFTKWWLSRSPHDRGLPLPFKNDERPMVLYLASNPSVTTRAGVERLREAMVKYKERLRFVVKVHSRRDRTELFKSFSDSGIEVVGNEIASPQLINSAEYIVVTVTSVIIDAILKERPIVFAKFTTENEPSFQKYEVFAEALSGSALEEIFEQMADREWDPEVRTAAVESYLKDCVYGGLPSEGSLVQGFLDLFSRAVNAKSHQDFTGWVEVAGRESLSRLK